MKPFHRISIATTVLAVTGVLSIAYATVTIRGQDRDQRIYSELLNERTDPQVAVRSTDGDSSLIAHIDRYVYVENPNLKWININQDYVGWLEIMGTNIDYPVVRSTDNQYYLKRNFYRSSSSSGSIFMDYRNVGNFYDRHTIIYGHNMRNRTMFAQLDAFVQEGFFQSDPRIRLSGLYESRDFSVFSVHYISPEDYVFPLAFSDDNFVMYLEYLASLSIIPSDMAFDSSSLLLTLVTCTNDSANQRLVLHALHHPRQR